MTCLGPDASLQLPARIYTSDGLLFFDRGPSLAFRTWNDTFGLNKDLLGPRPLAPQKPTRLEYRQWLDIDWFERPMAFGSASAAFKDKDWAQGSLSRFHGLFARSLISHRCKNYMLSQTSRSLPSFLRTNQSNQEPVQYRIVLRNGLYIQPRLHKPTPVFQHWPLLRSCFCSQSMGQRCVSYVRTRFLLIEYRPTL